jgi:phage terminase large subunit
VIKEFKNYTYRQDKEGRWLNEPIDTYNHAIDATRYVVMTEIMGGERRPVNISRLAKQAF